MNKVFESREYKQDKSKFFFVEKNRFLESAVVYTDNKTYVAVQGKKGLPVWVWTVENLSLNKLKELKSVLTNFLSEDKVSLTTRKEVYDYLVNSNYPYLNKDSYFEMGFLKCSKTLKPNECDGYYDHFTENDYDTLAHYYYLDQQEMGLNSDVTLEYAYEHVKNWLNNEMFYAWRNADGKVVSMLGYDTFDNMAKLAAVYTPPEERRKGYCANLVYHVTSDLLEKGLEPVLYTDYHYPNSNGAYKKVGYEDLGYLVNYTLKRK